MPYKIITQPTGEQISLAQAREHLLIFFDGDSPTDYPDDNWLNGVGIPAARQYCENWLGRALAPQTLELALDAFPERRTGVSADGYASLAKPAAIVLPMGPVTALTSVKYTDSDGAEQTLAGNAYTFDNYSEPARVVLLASTAWPAIKAIPNAVRVRYVAGYDLPADSPQTNPLPYAIRAAMLLTLGHLFEHREAVSYGSGNILLHEIPLGIEHLLRPYQLRLSMA